MSALPDRFTINLSALADAPPAAEPLSPCSTAMKSPSPQGIAEALWTTRLVTSGFWAASAGASEFKLVRVMSTGCGAGLRLTTLVVSNSQRVGHQKKSSAAEASAADAVTRSV